MSTISRKISSFLIGIFLFTGLPLLAWGIRDVSGFFQNWCRYCYFFLMIGLTALAVLFVPEEGRGGGEGEKPLKRQKFAIILMQITSVSVVLIGPYSDRHGIWVFGESGFIRHPRYLGIMTFMSGISFVFRSWAAVLISLITAMILIWRINDEERLLRQKFAKEWENYKSNSWRLIPFLY